MDADMYQQLGVSQTASQSEIKAAYRSKARLYHPDRSGDEDAERFRQVQAAYETLTDASSRQAYDQMLIFNRACDYVKGMVCFDEICLTLEQMFHGGTYTHPNGVYEIPAGIIAGVFQSPNLPPLKIRQLQHERFVRDDDDNLHIIIDIGLRESLLGTQIYMRGIDGAAVQAHIPASYELPPPVVAVHGAGMRNMHSRTRGDLLIHCHVRLTTELTEHQRSVLSDHF